MVNTAFLGGLCVWTVFNFKIKLKKNKKPPSKTRENKANRGFKAVQGSNSSKDKENELISKDVDLLISRKKRKDVP